MFNKIKYGLLRRPLELCKTHDFCKSGSPKLTVVFIHGIAADSSSFSKAIRYLEGTMSMQDVRFVAFDLLGAGKSYRADKLNYDFGEQLEALDNSIKKLNSDVPIVIVAHSMGTMLATRFLDNHRKIIKSLILVSPPVYRAEDIKNPLFEQAMAGFREVVGRKNREILKSKAFNSEIKNIVMNTKNYDYLLNISKPSVLIYGKLDEIIAPFNIPTLLKKNPNITAIQTSDSHSISHEKYAKILEILERTLNETI